LHIRDDHRVGESKQSLFEYTLRCMSTQAFDALLSCGVRDLTGLLGLTVEGLRQAGIPSRITAELMLIQLQLREQTQSSQQKNGSGQDTAIDKSIPEERQEPNDARSISVPKLLQDTQIPKDLMNNLSTRAQDALVREEILTCQRLLQFQEKDLTNLTEVGKKTLYEILHLQEKIAQLHPELRQILVKTAQNEEPKCDHRTSFSPWRAAYLPPCREHRVSDPAEWSLLSRTLPEIFNVTLPHSSSSIDAAQFTINDLGIPPIDVDRLRGMVLFPEDPADVLFSISVSYLLDASIGDKTLSIILDYLARICGFTDRFHIIENLSDIAIFADIKTSLFEEFLLAEFSNLGSILTSVLNAPITKVGDIEKMSERSIIERCGFTIQGLKALQCIWKIKGQALKIEKAMPQGLPVEAYVGFEPLVDAFVQSVVGYGAFGKTSKLNMASSAGNDLRLQACRFLRATPTSTKRHYNLLKGRLGWLDGRKWTLEELGQRENLTRERVRQIEQKLMSFLQKPRTLERLYRLWLAVNEAVTAAGGVCWVAEVAESLRKRWQWPTLPSDEALATLIDLSSNYDVDWTPPIKIIMPHCKCVSCTEVGTALAKTVETQPNGMLPFGQAFSIMGEFCQGQPCYKSSSVLQFSTAYLHFLADAIENIEADDIGFYTQYAWGIKYGKSRTLIVETVLRDAGRAMHFTEVRAEVNKDLSIYQQLSERNIYGYISRAPNLLLWDRGTYIHRDHISIPFNIIAKIEKDLITRLEENIPYLSVSGIFEKHKDDLLTLGVPSESALYSCLRESNSQALVYPEYPYIMRRESHEPRLPLQLVLEEFVLDQERMVTLDQIRKYAVDKLCVYEPLFTAYYIQHIPNLLRVDHGKYIHLYQLEIHKDKLEPIIAHLNILLSSSNHVSAIKLFNDKKITCKLLGITTPISLFSIIQIFYSDQFNLSRYPSIRLPAGIADGGRSNGVVSEVIRYIREKETPCSFAELYQHFVDDLGYEQMSLHHLFYSCNEIIRYSRGVVVHIETLAWTEGKQAVLELLAASHLRNRESSGKAFGLISNLFEYMYDQLPELPPHISWTLTLVNELLSRGENYRILGTQRNAFVSVPNSYGIENLDDLLYYILDAEYEGAANIDHFLSDMREAGIMKKNLTSLMLGSDSRVVIDGNVVQLARLHDSVKRA